MRHVIQALVAAVFVSACAAMPGSHSKALAADGPGSELRVGVAPNYPPMAFKQDGRLTGIEPEFARQLGTDLGVTITLVETPWEDLIPALRAHRIDVIMSGMSITDERKQVVSFTDSYLRVGQMALIRRADDARFRKLTTKELSSLRVGVVRGTTGEQYARANLPSAHVKTFDAVDAGVAALRKKEIDAFVHDAPAIWRITGGFDSSEHELMGRFRPLTDEHLAWAVRQDDGGPLRARLDAALAQWKANGQLDAILDHWIKVRKTTISVKPMH
jgi:polar amino acid transport system substrate-binding protein